MKRTILLFFGITMATLNTSACAQGNLIRNPSFEDVNNNYCPYNIMNFSNITRQYIQHWQAEDVMPPDLNSTNTKDTPDYYNTCTNGIFGIPDNIFGFQDAKEGNAYMGLIHGYEENIHNIPNIIEDRSEYLIQELATPLTAGIRYSFRMFVSLADNSPFGTSHLGAAFVDALPFAGGYPTGEVLSQITPQIESRVAITDKDNWTEISGTFTATGGEKYLLIGRFTPHTDVTVEPPSNNFEAYYYIDNISLTVGNLATETVQKETVAIYPNPAKETIQISGIEHTAIQSVAIYDINGRKVLSQNTFKNNSVDISTISAGTYLLQLVTKEGAIIKEKIIKD